MNLAINIIMTKGRKQGSMKSTGNLVVMDELVLLNKPKFNNQLDKNYYYFLNKKLYRVYPLFLTALAIQRYSGEMTNMDSKAKENYQRPTEYACRSV
jgi:hypothetical protein